jgi:hypothetical protein
LTHITSPGARKYVPSGQSLVRLARVFARSQLKRIAVVLTVAAAAGAFAYHVSSQPMDFRVYHFGANGVFDGTRPVYGITSGLGWPMHYRYPPLFLLLFAPLASVPLGMAAAIWVVAKILLLAGLLSALRKSPRNVGGKALVPNSHYIIPFLLMAPYLIEEFRYGNAQFFILALTIAALLIVRERPLTAAAFLGLAISIKVWPAFFLPYLLVRREWRACAYTFGFIVILTLLPAAYFGFQHNLDLLGKWFDQEFQTQLSEGEIWFPNQSLRGVLMRYLTVIEYSQMPDSNYERIHFASLDASTVRRVWMLLAAGIYTGFLFLSHRRRESDGWLDHALAFCLLAMLQPFTQKYALAVLLWPAIAAAALLTKPLLRGLIYGAATLALVQPLVSGAGAQRFLQVMGFDFAVVLLLTAALALACFQFKDVPIRRNL